MLPPRVIPDPQHSNLAKSEISELVVISAHNSVKGPKFGMFLCKIAQRQHLALEFGRCQIAHGAALHMNIDDPCARQIGPVKPGL